MTARHRNKPAVKTATVDLTKVAEPTPDWTILDDERVETIINMVAASVGSKYGDVTTADDISQDAAIHCALRADEVRKIIDEPLVGERWLYRWLYADMVDAVRTPADRSKRLVPITDLSDADAA